MWSHYCKAEKHSMYTEDGAECNWCGARAEDQVAYPPKEKSFDVVKATHKTLEEFKENEVEEVISNVEVTDMPDGSAKVVMDITPEGQSMLIKQGLEYLIEEMRMTDKLVVLEPNEFDKETKTWELSDDDANALSHFGFIHALKSGMKDD
jgi:hypothetical protein